MNPAGRRVAVIGAGAIGLAAAYALRRRDYEVIVLDRGEPGQGCSAGNAGWICPSYSAPLPAPGLPLTALKWMMRSDSPLYIAPGALLRLAPFLLRFWSRCNPRDYDRGLEATVRFCRGAQASYDRLAADGVSFELHRDGLLSIFRDADGLREWLTEHEPFTRHGYAPPEFLPPDELARREPSLADGLAGGYFVREEYHIRPETLTAGYATRLRALGVEIRSGTEVRSIRSTGDRATAIETASGLVAADAVVVAAGALTGRLLAPLGLRLPMTAGKGYSITVTDPRFRIAHPISLGGLKVSCSPFEGGIRFGGTMELSGLDERLDRRRLAAIRAGVAKFFRVPLDEGVGTEWVGMRPLLPDGMPVIGPVPRFDNLYVASGHSMLGITMAPLTGEAVARLVAGDRMPELAPFDPGRFG